MLLVLRGSATADTLVYEGFNYGPAGSALLGQNGGSGFSSAWQAAPAPANSNSNYLIGSSGGLSFNGLDTTGESATSAALPSSIGGIRRTLNQPLGADGTTEYLSFLLRPEGTLNSGFSSGYFGIFLQSSLVRDLFIGKPGGGAINDYAMEERGGTSQVSTGVQAVVDQTVFLVMKAEFLAGNDRFTLYVNPTPGGSEPLTGTVESAFDTGSITGLEIFSAGAFSVDEIHIGTTFADVASVPEPSQLVPVGAAAALFLLRRRMTRKQS
jgi:hypothetical protein